MSGDNVMQRFTSDLNVEALARAMREAEEQDRSDEMAQRAADQRVKQLLRDGAL